MILDVIHNKISVITDLIKLPNLGSRIVVIEYEYAYRLVQFWHGGFFAGMITLLGANDSSSPRVLTRWRS